ncbi:MAG TPA: hypothetical protein VFR84_04340 [Candidatus Angelobacter sp.]|nr:hypothetical protein [Candidatus Angelobacter sp.]
MDQGSAPAPEQPSSQPQPPPAPKRRKAVLIPVVVVAVIAAALLAIWLYNQSVLQSPLSKVLASDSRNKTVIARAHFDHWIDTGTVVFDLSDVSGESSAGDIFRVFLQFAQSQKDHTYKQVVLAAYGEKKFTIPGDYFHELGTEYGSQNPMYTIRTFPHHVADMNGEHPFPEYSGGLLGVLNKEMEEFNDMNRQWFQNDYMARHK